MKSLFFLRKAVVVLSLMLVSSAAVFVQCEEDEFPRPNGPVKSCATCTFVIAGDDHTQTIDGNDLGVEPGDTICLDAAAHYGGAFIFENINGTAAKPVIITNCGGTVNLKVSKPWNFKMAFSKNFRVTGGDTDGYYGIRMSGSTGSGLVVTDLSTDFEVDHIEVFNVGFAGIMAKTDPNCDDAYNRGNFTMRNVKLHDNFIHDTEGEGFYIGHFDFDGHPVDGCGEKLPHLIENIDIHHNYCLRTGWDGIQLSCASQDAIIHENIIEEYAFGATDRPDQRNAIIIGAGSVANCYNNFISHGLGNGIACFGVGDNVIYNNIILGSGEKGIFADERASTGDGVKILNNTIINAAEVGIALYTETLPDNVVVNNIIVNPGKHSEWKDMAFINHGKSLVFTKQNNFTTLNIEDIKFVSTRRRNYRLQESSPAIDQGFDVSSFNIGFDFYMRNRKNGSAYDIGASEY